MHTHLCWMFIRLFDMKKVGAFIEALSNLYRCACASSIVNSSTWWHRQTPTGHLMSADEILLMVSPFFPLIMARKRI